MERKLLVHEKYNHMVNEFSFILLVLLQVYIKFNSKFIDKNNETTDNCIIKKRKV